MNHEKTATPTDEFEAIQTVHKALEPLSTEGRIRVVNYIVDLLGIGDDIKASPAGSQGDNEEAKETMEQKGDSKSPNQFSTFAELHDVAGPVTSTESALVAAYWVEHCEGKENFGSQAVNKELKHLGTGFKNITGVFDQLRKAEPALILQLRKGGKSRQARKTYKITDAGMKRVQEMISG